MKKQLIDVLKDKYGKEYEIKEVEQFKKINITVIPGEGGSNIYKLREAKGNWIYTTWNSSLDKLLNKLINK
jgi:hypothetical protein